MEQFKGGNLVNLPERAKAVLDALHGGSPASYAIRFAAGFPNVKMVLSGMSTLAQVEENTAFMRDFRPLEDVYKRQELWCLAAITGGAIGNLIDRIRTGAVVDMISIPWFSTFNVADLFITFGAIILVLYIFIKDKEFLSDGPKKDKTDDADAEH